MVTLIFGDKSSSSTIFVCVDLDFVLVIFSEKFQISPLRCCFSIYILIPWASILSYPLQDIEMSTRSCSRVRFSFIPPMGIRSLSTTGGHWNVHPQLHRDTYIHPMGLNHCRILRLPLSAALEHLNSSNQHPFALARCRSLRLKMTKNE